MLPLPPQPLYWGHGRAPHQVPPPVSPPLSALQARHQWPAGSARKVPGAGGDPLAVVWGREPREGRCSLVCSKWRLCPTPRPTQSVFCSAEHCRLSQPHALGLTDPRSGWVLGRPRTHSQGWPKAQLSQARFIPVYIMVLIFKRNANFI